MNYDFSNFPLDIVLNILGIIILFIVIRLLAYKPVKKFLDERRGRIAADKEEAKGKIEEAEKMKAEYEEKLSSGEAEAQRRADAIIADARMRAEEIVNEASERSEKVLAMAEAKIKADREASKKERERETLQMAFEIAEKVLERRVNDSDTINMAQQLFDELDGTK